MMRLSWRVGLRFGLMTIGVAILVFGLGCLVAPDSNLLGGFGLVAAVIGAVGQIGVLISCCVGLGEYLIRRWRRAQFSRWESRSPALRSGVAMSSNANPIAGRDSLVPWVTYGALLRSEIADAEQLVLAEGVRLVPLPEWARSGDVLKYMSERTRRSLGEFEYALSVEYQADSLGMPDPSWGPTQERDCGPLAVARR